MATTISTPDSTTTAIRRSTSTADSLVADRQAHWNVDSIDIAPPQAPARYPGRWLDRLRRADSAAPSPRDFVLAEVDLLHTVHSIQR